MNARTAVCLLAQDTSAREASWNEFCAEPWLGAHESWNTLDEAPAWWTSISGKGRFAQRMAAGIWLRHFSLEPMVPGLVNTVDALGTKLLAMSARDLLLAAGRVGLVATASRQNFSADWLGRSADYFLAASPEDWRSAMQTCRMRRLSTTGRSAERIDSDAIQSLGIGWMSKVCAERWPQLSPQLWPRLRIRFPRHLVDSDRPGFSEDAQLADAADIRQVIRIWSAST